MQSDFPNRLVLKLKDTTPDHTQLHQACFLIGSNIDPVKNTRLAIQLICTRISIHNISSVYETKAMGSEGPNFLNCAIWVETGLSREELVKEVIAPVETELGRIRTANKNAPRTIDIDLIIFDGNILDDNLWTYPYLAITVSEVLPETFSKATRESLANAAGNFLRSGLAILRDDIKTECWPRG